MNYEYKSIEELYFSWYLTELLKCQVIEHFWYEPNTFTLAETKRYIKNKELKTKITRQELVLLSDIAYTPDFLVKWNNEYDGIFYRLINKDYYFNAPPFFAFGSKKLDIHYSFFEVKGNFDRHNEVRMFTYLQKWLYEKKNIYVQLARVPKIFKDTFTPSRYLVTDKTQKPRSIRFTTRPLKNYTEVLNKDKNVIPDLFYGKIK
jgi:hypothetical protein